MRTRRRGRTDVRIASGPQPAFLYLLIGPGRVDRITAYRNGPAAYTVAFNALPLFQVEPEYPAYIETILMLYVLARASSPVFKLSTRYSNHVLSKMIVPLRNDSLVRFSNSPISAIMTMFAAGIRPSFIVGPATVDYVQTVQYAVEAVLGKTRFKKLPDVETIDGLVSALLEIETGKTFTKLMNEKLSQYYGPAYKKLKEIDGLLFMVPAHIAVAETILTIMIRPKLLSMLISEAMGLTRRHQPRVKLVKDNNWNYKLSVPVRNVHGRALGWIKTNLALGDLDNIISIFSYYRNYDKTFYEDLRDHIIDLLSWKTDQVKTVDETTVQVRVGKRLLTCNHSFVCSRS